MEVSPISTQQFMPPAAQPSALSSDFETFLRMLTVQMQNQDPLNPTDSGDYAVQLATFSGVEQQVRGNDLLQQLVSGGEVSGLANLAGWIGKDARAPVSGAWSGTPITVFGQAEATADAAELVIMDDQGNEVQRFGFDPADKSMEWAGAGPDGSPIPYGNYRFYVASYAQDETLGVTQAEVYQPVTEVRIENGVSRVFFASGESVASRDVTALRN